MARLLFVGPDARFLVSHRFNLIIGALAQGHEVIVASPDGAAVEQIVAAGARHVAVPLELDAASVVIALNVTTPFDTVPAVGDNGSTASTNPDAAVATLAGRVPDRISM